MALTTALYRTAKLGFELYAHRQNRLGVPEGNASRCHEATPQRTLLKQLYRDWRSLNPNVRRGMTFPPLHVVKKTLEHFF